MKKFLGFLVILATIFICSSAFATSLVISWSANTETDLSGYKIYYGIVSGAGTGVYANSLDVGNVITCTLSNVTDGDTYYVALKAYDTSNNYSGFSDEASIFIPIPDITPPGVPTGITTTVTGATVKLTWTAVVASDLAGYGVYDNGVLIGSATVPTYTTGTLAQGSHSFTIDSVDTTGNRSAKSVAAVVKIDTIAPVKPGKPTISIVR